MTMELNVELLTEDQQVAVLMARMEMLAARLEQLNEKIDCRLEALDRKMEPLCRFYARVETVGWLGRGFVWLAGALLAIGVAIAKLSEWVQANKP